ncbi:MAG TPA: AAA family ATPase [candidate division Zixibacteria bacterium]|nr:AAA family ATPase [candidate division Zixibacteria bacterium]
MNEEIMRLNERIAEESRFVEDMRAEFSKVIVGQKLLIDRLIIGLLANGHVLLEGVPGIAKTLSVQTLANIVQAEFQRIQFTPDLLPADIVGTLVYNQAKGTFTTKQGPIFANIILADEINRAPAKVQSALLEAMQERQVTIGEETFPLPNPFMVLATQNPIEQQGTYPLPEAQVDRFLLKVIVEYPEREEEREVMRIHGKIQPPRASATVKPEDIVKARATVRDIYVDEKIESYILDLVFATRKPSQYGLDELEELIQYGASPRATLYLRSCAQARAFMQHRGYVTPEDVRTIAMDVLRHRVIPTYEAEAEEITSEDIVRKVLGAVEVP